ncbi:MAG: NADH-quinone oxidoreductase subunit NuoN [Immundisolibacteraceae bacterium]|nr:NADH-quinone oxidoreductase subunit NuoN [Immundisolibacteraceae bacterium]
MSFSVQELIPVLPEIVLLIGASVVLLVDLFAPGKGRASTYLWSLIALAATALALVYSFQGPQIVLGGHYQSDALSLVLKLGMVIGLACVLLYGRSYLAARDLLSGEFFTLSLFALLGMMIIASGGSLLSLYLGLETLSLSLYALVGFDRRSVASSEAAIKYFILGALASGMLLYGISILYGVTGTLNLVVLQGEIAAVLTDTDARQFSMLLGLGVVFVVVGAAFKLGAAPFHMWLPDIYEGSPTAVTNILGTVSKLAAIALVLRLFADGLQPLLLQWQPMMMMLAVMSLAIGNIVAIAQTNIKRMLAYSAISHMGFVVLGVLAGTAEGYSASLFYMLTYALTGLAAFGMIMILSREGFEADKLDDYKGLGQRSPVLALIMMVVMFSMAGVPPTVGFFAKLAVIEAVMAQGHTWIAIVAVLFSVIGAFYYLRMVKLMFFDDVEDPSPIEAAWDERVVISLNGLAILALGIFPGGLLAVCSQVF